MQVFAQEPTTNLLNGERIAQWPERVREPKEKSFSLFAFPESFFGEPPLSDVEFQSSKPHYLPFSITIGLAKTLYPRYGPIESHNPKRDVPVVPRPPPQNLVEEVEYRAAVFVVNTGEPCVERRQFFLGKAV